MSRDETLIKWIAEGEEWALEAFIKIHQGPLKGYLCRMLGNQSTVEEVANDAFLAVWNGANGFKGDGSPKAWLFGIARYKALNRISARHRRLLTEDIDDVDRPALTHSPEEILVTKDRIEKALEQISEPRRELIMLVHIDGFSYKEVAQILEINSSTARTRVFYAFRKLRQLLSEGEPENGA